MEIQQYLFNTKMNAQNLATKARLSFATVYNAMKGRPINIASAKRIVEATEGQVTYEDLLPKSDQESENKPNHKT